MLFDINNYPVFRMVVPLKAVETPWYTRESFLRASMSTPRAAYIMGSPDFPVYAAAPGSHCFILISPYAFVSKRCPNSEKNVYSMT